MLWNSFSDLSAAPNTRQEERPAKQRKLDRLTATQVLLKDTNRLKTTALTRKTSNSELMKPTSTARKPTTPKYVSARARKSLRKEEPVVLESIRAPLPTSPKKPKASSLNIQNLPTPLPSSEIDLGTDSRPPLHLQAVPPSVLLEKTDQLPEELKFWCIVSTFQATPDTSSYTSMRSRCRVRLATPEGVLLASGWIMLDGSIAPLPHNLKRRGIIYIDCRPKEEQAALTELHKLVKRSVWNPILSRRPSARHVDVYRISQLHKQDTQRSEDWLGYLQ